MNPVHPAWQLFTRLGEAQILLPAMAAAALWLARTPATRACAGRWVLSGSAVATLTLASKVAFIGFALGVAAIDFTGFSGHAMFAALVLPVLARSAAEPSARGLAVTAGYVLAAALALSRVVTDEHSVSESVSGFALGAAASAWTLWRGAAPASPLPRLLLLALAIWLLTLPAAAPPSRTHDWVTSLSLRVSGHARPYTRNDLHRRSGLAAGEVQRDPVVQRQ